jgi:uncharacterized protein
VTVAAPLVYPLAGLVGEPPGSSRHFLVNGVTITLPADLRLASPLEGRVDVARTNRGVIVRADLRAALEGTCSRCLKDLETPVAIHLDEEVLPSLDISTGHRLDWSAEPEVARLTDHHELELGKLVADALSLAEPIAPLCEPDCPGLCPTCGDRLDPGHRDHPGDEIDPRLAALQAFKVDAERETG